MEVKEIMLLVISIVLGIGVLIGVANNLMYTQQSVASVTNESFANTAYNQSITLKNPKVRATTLTIANASDNTAGLPNTLRSGSEYALNANAGIVQIINRTSGTNGWYASYQYEPAAYVGNTLVQTIYAAAIPLIAVAVLFLIWGYVKVD